MSRVGIHLIPVVRGLGRTESTLVTSGLQVSAERTLHSERGAFSLPALMMLFLVPLISGCLTPWKNYVDEGAEQIYAAADFKPSFPLAREIRYLYRDETAFTSTTVENGLFDFLEGGEVYELTVREKANSIFGIMAQAYGMTSDDGLMTWGAIADQSRSKATAYQNTYRTAQREGTYGEQRGAGLQAEFANERAEMAETARDIMLYTKAAQILVAGTVTTFVLSYGESIEEKIQIEAAESLVGYVADEMGVIGDAAPKGTVLELKVDVVRRELSAAAQASPYAKERSAGENFSYTVTALLVRPGIPFLSVRTHKIFSRSDDIVELLPGRDDLALDDQYLLCHGLCSIYKPEEVYPNAAGWGSEHRLRFMEGYKRIDDYCGGALRPVHCHEVTLTAMAAIRNLYDQASLLGTSSDRLSISQK